MKKKSNGSDPITKEYLDTALSGLRGEFSDFKAGLKGEFSDFKAEMKSEFSDFKAEMKGDFEVFRAEIRDEVKDTITNALDKLYIRIDPLIAEIEDNREDRALTTQQLSDLDKRVTKLENPN